MTLLLRLPRRLLSAVALTLACSISATHSMASAAELEGTVVPLGDSAPLQLESNPPLPDVVAPVKPLPPPDVVAPLEPVQPPTVVDQDRAGNDREFQWHDHQNWERDWEKNLGQAFAGGARDEEHGGSNGMQALIVFFSVIALIMFLCSPLILVGFYLTLRYKAKSRHQQALNTNIDKLLAAGRDIPVELLRGDEPKSADDDADNQAKGIRNLCLGAGWLVFLTIAFGIGLGAVGFIWIALGTSQLLIWYLNRPAAIDQVGQQD